MRCCICHKEITEIESNNPWPLAGDSCCKECNDSYVIWFRMQQASKKAAIVVGTDGSIQAVYPENKDQFELEEMQKLVGGYIEVAEQVIPGYLTLVDEEGLLKNSDRNIAFGVLFKKRYFGNVVLVPEELFK